MSLIVTSRALGARCRPRQVRTGTCRCLCWRVVRPGTRGPRSTRAAPRPWLASDRPRGQEMVDYRDGSVTRPLTFPRRRGLARRGREAIDGRVAADHWTGLAQEICIVPRLDQDGQRWGWHCVDLPVELEQRTHSSVLRREQRSGLGQLSCSGPDAVPTESERLMRQSLRHTDRLRAMRRTHEVRRHPATLLKGA